MCGSQGVPPHASSKCHYTVFASKSNLYIIEFGFEVRGNGRQSARGTRLARTDTCDKEVVDGEVGAREARMKRAASGRAPYLPARGWGGVGVERDGRKGRQSRRGDKMTP